MDLKTTNSDSFLSNSILVSLATLLAKWFMWAKVVMAIILLYWLNWQGLTLSLQLPHTTHLPTHPLKLYFAVSQLPVVRFEHPLPLSPPSPLLPSLLWTLSKL